MGPYCHLDRRVLPRVTHGRAPPSRLLRWPSRRWSGLPRADGGAAIPSPTSGRRTSVGRGSMPSHDGLTLVNRLPSCFPGTAANTIGICLLLIASPGATIPSPAGGRCGQARGRRGHPQRVLRRAPVAPRELPLVVRTSSSDSDSLLQSPTTSSYGRAEEQPPVARSPSLPP